MRIDMKRNYAFVQFKTVEEAIRARDGTNGGKLDQSEITVEYVARRMGEGGGGRGGGDRDDRRGSGGGGRRFDDRDRGEFDCFPSRIFGLDGGGYFGCILSSKSQLHPMISFHLRI